MIGPARTMLNRFVLPALLAAGFAMVAGGTVLPPEQLLPKDTVLVVTAPDCPAAWSVITNLPYGRLWNDPQLKPFKDKFIDKFTTEVITPMERTLSAHVSDYRNLARGQATFAMMPVNQPDKPNLHFGFVLILDTKDQAGLLRTNLSEIKKKWADAGKPMRSARIRETDFSTLIISPEDLSWDKILAKPKAPSAPEEPARVNTNKVELTVGQVDTLLVISDSTKAIEKVLSRQSGGLIAPLAEEPSFQSDYAARLHDSPFYAWVNFKAVVENATKAAGDEEESGMSAVLRPESLLGATGLTGISSGSLSYHSSPEGLSAQLFIGAPESKRRGLLKALAAEPKDANPPSFVPASVGKFWRWRINLPQSWSQIETILNDSNPQYANLINFILQTAGKDKDEKYDLKAQLLGNLGDDIIHYEKPPQDNTLAALNSPPSIYLIGSPDPEKLANALKTGLSFMGQAKDREFLGRTICTLTTQGQGGAPAHSFSFSGSGGYLAISGDPGILEEFLRSTGDKDLKSLRDMPGLSEAAQRVGGMGTGLFGFDNESAVMRPTIEALRQQTGGGLQQLLGPAAAMSSVKVKDWADFSLLPPFDAISQYFYFSVFSGRFNPDGFVMEFFGPTPPKLR